MLWLILIILECRLSLVLRLLITSCHHGLLSSGHVTWLANRLVRVVLTLNKVCCSDDLLVVDCDRWLQGIGCLVRVDVDCEHSREDEVHDRDVDKEATNTSQSFADFLGTLLTLRESSITVFIA